MKNGPLARALGLMALGALAISTPGRSEAQAATLVPAATENFTLSAIVRHNTDFFYFAITERGGLEASFCMIGVVDKKVGDKSGVAKIRSLLPLWIDSASKGALYQHIDNCMKKDGALGIVHFHPPGSSCEMSDMDLVSAHYSGYAYEGIVCEAKGALPRMAMVAKKEFDKAWKTLPTEETESVSVPGGSEYPVVYRYRKPPA